MAYSQRSSGLEPYFLLELPGTERGGEPTGKVAEAIAASFGSFAISKLSLLMQRSKTLVLAGPGGEKQRWQTGYRFNL